jgi:DNA-directed RNA polymerase subunit N (RpoN/RPB10)
VSASEEKGEMNMSQKKIKTEVTLESDRLGSEEKIQAVLTDWGMDKRAIRRMLDEHRTRQVSARGQTIGPANISLAIHVNHAPVNSSSSP